MRGVKRRDFLMIGTAGLLAVSGAAAAPRRPPARARERILLDTGWRFR